ncbi:hydrophobic/amphiphilic exporter-1, HAE1 family [Desulfonispora thiosulfatigenes DSM 11270]|uniref:Hydrophobic/amphiphilic exporter-1, HAE1 family n=1 Tax=Desulfonispora thiosulfatigenes DSM 11270 TaxID=656914 RepID=A0A1W1V519_DESTI|nr:efflux RND transporter permease subunit [Desulfonispora thiosulfatigenes]SMB88442.1 hydrophobic/amphiphilic exporter-1, HAE1 family [Desulfonispora thiosulfatigenes DSM 11270]
MKLSDLSVRRPVLIFMIVLAILMLGAVSMTQLAIDLFPEMDVPVALTIVEYDGVGPEEMEKLVTKPLEEQLSTINGVKTVRSQSTLGSSVVITEFNWGTDMDNNTIKMREKVDFIKAYLPEDVSEPMIFKMDLNMFPIMMLGVTGDGDLAQVKQTVENKIKPRLERIAGVASVDVSGGKTREIQVEVSPYMLQAYGLSIQDISNIIRGENNNFSVGSVEQGKKDYLVRVKGEFKEIKEIEEILIPLKTGETIALKNLAQIKNTYEEQKSYSLLNGQPSISLNIQKQSDANTVKVSDAVQEELETLKNELPGNIKIEMAMDQAEFIRKSIDGVKQNGYIGALLAVVVLFLFLRSVRSTLIVGTAIPISIIATFILIYFSGLTLNMMSLGGLALGIGMMVDSAIVILENIYRYREEGYSRFEAAKLGASEVGSAVVASTITTICVFLPIVYVEGIASQIFRPLALTVTFSLIASLLVALSLVPMLSSKLLVVDIKKEKPKNIFQKIGGLWVKFLDGLDNFYSMNLKWAINHKFIVIVVTIAGLVGSAFLIPKVGMEFMPAQDNGMFTVQAKLPNSTVLGETSKIATQVEASIAEIKEVDSIFMSVGSGGGMATGNFGSGSNMISITGNLVPLTERTRSVQDIMDEIREKNKNLAGVALSVTAEGGSMGSGSPIDITIKGHDLDVLKNLEEQFAQKIETVEGTREITTSLEEGVPELTVNLDREKASLYGITSSQLSGAIRMGLQGATSSKYRTGGDEINIKVFLPEKDRGRIDDLNRLMVSSPMGVNVPVEEIATLKYETGPTTISRVDQSRTVSITGDIAGRDLKSVTEDIQKAVKEIPLPSGYQVEFGGSNKDMIESFTSLGLALIMAIFLVYMVLAAQFEALLYPFIIMFSLPPTLIGVVGGLLLTGKTFSVISFIGVIMLAGIVVNNAIVLVDYIGVLRSRGMEKTEAILKAGPTRLRPILMTTLTTVLALLPQALGIGEGSEVSAPMAIVVVFGLSFSTIITLILIPVVYSILDSFAQKIKNFFTRIITGDKNTEAM